MTRTRRRALVAALVAILAAGAAALALGGMPGAREKPQLMLLTSLPLMFGEELSFDPAGSPALEALEDDFRVVAIPASSPAELARGRLLLMAHPLAQPPEALVALDEWVRGGGRVLLLADPFLEWPDSRPLGDPTRPPPMFMDTGLLAHWGLRLDAPEERGERSTMIGGVAVVTRSPGKLSGTCPIGSNGIVARCAVGRGEAVVVADADLLNVDAAGDRNLAGIVAELRAMAKR